MRVDIDNDKRLHRKCAVLPLVLHIEYVDVQHSLCQLLVLVSVAVFGYHILISTRRLRKTCCSINK
jgi:hypothetical protein